MAIVYRKQKDPVNEKRLLMRFAEQVHAPGASPNKLLQRLHAIGVTEAELSRIEARQAANLETAEELRVAAAKTLAGSFTDELQAVGLIQTEAERETEARIAKHRGRGCASVAVMWMVATAVSITGLSCG